MAQVKKTIGKLPVHKGVWVQGTAYARLNQVTYEGSCLQSKIDNNTNQPITISGNAFTVHSSWQMIADGTTALLAAQKADTATDRNQADISLIASKPTGLKFKSGDNTVFAKTMKELVLGNEDFTIWIIARTEGCQDQTYPLIGCTKSGYLPGGMRVYNRTDMGSNSIAYVLMQAPLQGDGAANSIRVTMIDSTTNLHTTVITRSGTLVTCIVNGRLVKSVTQDRVLDFSNFLFDIANTSFFWGGGAVNYAMLQEESNSLLWNGGRYDEVTLPSWMKVGVGVKTSYTRVEHALGSTCTIIEGDGYSDFVITNATGGYPRFYTEPFARRTGSVIIKIDCEALNGETVLISSVEGLTMANNPDNKPVNISSRTTVVFKGDCALYKGKTYHGFGTINNAGKTLRVYSYKVIYCGCLLEYRPENIRQDRVVNTGTVGADGDLIFSPTPPEILYEAPYKDKIVLEDKAAPDFHPIAVGQRCYTNNGSIYEANLPTGEWGVDNWKLQ